MKMIITSALALCSLGLFAESLVAHWDFSKSVNPQKSSTFQLWCTHSEAHFLLTCPRVLLKSALGKCFSLRSVHLSHPGI